MECHHGWVPHWRLAGRPRRLPIDAQRRHILRHPPSGHRRRLYWVWPHDGARHTSTTTTLGCRHGSRYWRRPSSRMMTRFTFCGTTHDLKDDEHDPSVRCGLGSGCIHRRPGLVAVGVSTLLTLCYICNIFLAWSVHQLGRSKRRQGMMVEISHIARAQTSRWSYRLLLIRIYQITFSFRLGPASLPGAMRETAASNRTEKRDERIR